MNQDHLDQMRALRERQARDDDVLLLDGDLDDFERPRSPRLRRWLIGAGTGVLGLAVIGGGTALAAPAFDLEPQDGGVTAAGADTLDEPGSAMVTPDDSLAGPTDAATPDVDAAPDQPAESELPGNDPAALPAESPRTGVAGPPGLQPAHGPLAGSAGTEDDTSAPGDRPEPGHKKPGHDPTPPGAALGDGGPPSDPAGEQRPGPPGPHH